MAGARNETTPLLDSSSIRSSASTLERDQATPSSDSDVESSVAIATGMPDPDIAAATARSSQTKPGDQPSLSTSALLQVVAVLAIGLALVFFLASSPRRLTICQGLFTSNLDGSIVLATHPRIASEFHALEESSWLFISFFLAGIATQTLVSVPMSDTSLCNQCWLVNLRRSE